MLPFRFFLSLMISIPLLFGCAPRKTVSGGKEAPDTTKAEIMEEQPTPGEQITPPEEEEDYPALPEGWRRVLGFRVHVFTGTLEEAKSLKKELESTTYLRVHLQSNPPFYNVEVGDFLTRDIAESIMRLLVSQGYPEAYVIETLVEIP